MIKIVHKYQFVMLISLVTLITRGCERSYASASWWPVSKETAACDMELETVPRSTGAWEFSLILPRNLSVSKDYEL
jgi:hypothetical protein